MKPEREGEEIRMEIGRGKGREGRGEGEDSGGAEKKLKSAQSKNLFCDDIVFFQKPILGIFIAR